MVRFSHRRREKLPWLASWVTLKPIPASARPSESARSPACHQEFAAKTRSAQEATAQTTTMPVFR